MNQLHKLITMLLVTSKAEMVFLQQIVQPSKALGDWRQNQGNSFDERNKIPLLKPMPPSPPVHLDLMMPMFPPRTEVDILNAPYQPPDFLHPIQLDIRLVPPPIYRLELPPRPFLPLPPEIPPPYPFLLPLPVPKTSATKSTSNTSYSAHNIVSTDTGTTPETSMSTFKSLLSGVVDHTAYNMVSIDQTEKAPETTPTSIFFSGTIHRQKDSITVEPIDQPKTWSSFSTLDFPLKDTAPNTSHRPINMVSIDQTEKTPETTLMSLLFSGTMHRQKDSIPSEPIAHPNTWNSFSTFDFPLKDTAPKISHGAYNMVSIDQSKITPEMTPMPIIFSGKVLRPDPLLFVPIDQAKTRNSISAFNTHRDTETNVVNTWKHSNILSFFPDTWFPELGKIKQDLNPDELVTAPSLLEDTSEKLNQNLITKRQKGMLRIIPVKKGIIGKKIGTLKQLKGQGKFSSLVRTLPSRYYDSSTFRRVFDFRQQLK